METSWILGDQLTPDHPALAEREPGSTRLLFVESRARAAHRRYHQQKLVLVYAAMRHRAAELREAGWEVDYRKLDDTARFEDGLAAHVREFEPERLVVMAPNDFPTTQALPKLAKKVGVELETLPTTMFLCEREEFGAWADDRNSLRMETFYRRMREQLSILVDDDGNPEGGEWNYDTENRETYAAFAKASPEVPTERARPHDDITEAVIAEVAEAFGDHPGRAADFWLPVHRGQALRWLENFIERRLAGFGPWEDTMVADEPILFHSVLTPMLNLGLLGPRECVDRAVEAYRAGNAPLASVEGFVRQIIGWREFINGVYWHRMPGYEELNHLQAERPLPRWAYDGDTEMNCLRSCIRQVIGTGYTHHIQRLMVLGNYFLLSGTRPEEALRWFNEMYVDAYDWVMAANVIGMALHADGGYMATKPYAAGSGYIQRMSNYCSGCRYKPSVKTGEDACPYNYLYWNFFARHEKRFASNHRVGMMLKTWQRKPAEEQRALRRQAEAFLDAQA